MDFSSHYKFMKEAFKVAETALAVREVPVGCVMVYEDQIIAKAFNQTNLTLNGTKHAEFEAYDQIRAKYPTSYEQVLRKTTLYVTVEPCIMCASLLRQLEIQTVVFGCPNERFGGNGSIFAINKDDLLNRPYQSIPGVLSKQAVMLLRKFYLLENSKSPASIGKKNRRLEQNEFPPIEYRKYLTKSEFESLFGKKFGFVYDNNLFLEFDDDGTVVNETPSKKLKTR
ncbi:hypothetical protein OGAPHI_004376 [Ogataea philodendri]|uniref:CMP/dCMP-type deaminase domain-containing protein n=1 Tax=Ogataea philodendri TaxID=1378263 RepID=A0A9P8P6H6_9ASCO|nr:uncharacterized protein OGAPHI_004376 [Ogataea philodendri]KAH3666187.1 hypothetical protein OGAPHI_004376 [Ogataea philodendri]